MISTVIGFGDWNTFHKLDDGIFLMELSGEVEYKYKKEIEWEPRNNRKIFIKSDCVVTDFYGQTYSTIEELSDKPLENPSQRKQLIDYKEKQKQKWEQNQNYPEYYPQYYPNEYYPNENYPQYYPNENFIQFSDNPSGRKKYKNICVSGQVKDGQRISKAHFRDASNYTKKKYTAVSGYTTKTGTKVRAYRRKK